MAADTKQMIADSLFGLLEHKKIDDITVKYLVEYCGISRQTFYYHFQDIMDVLEWKLRQGVEQALEDSLRASDAREAIGGFVSLVVSKKAVARRLLQSQRRAELEELLANAFRTYHRELFRRRWPDSRLPAADAEAMLCFHTYGMIGLILERCRQENVDVDQLTDQICRLISGEMRGERSEA